VEIRFRYAFPRSIESAGVQQRSRDGEREKEREEEKLP
jgi:hypothetical protein